MSVPANWSPDRGIERPGAFADLYRMFTRPRATFGVVLGCIFLLLFEGGGGPALRGHLLLIPGALGAFLMAARDVRVQR